MTRPPISVARLELARRRIFEPQQVPPLEHRMRGTPAQERIACLPTDRCYQAFTLKLLLLLWRRGQHNEPLGPRPPVPALQRALRFGWSTTSGDACVGGLAARAVRSRLRAARRVRRQRA